jgi:NAD(P)H-hydrate epimerase
MPSDRQEAAGRLAQSTGSIVALKGAGTVVTDGQRVYINNSGNPGMATAGSGDVLTGIIVALMGQGLDNFAATVLGVHIHGAAGDIAADNHGQISLMATDIVETLPQAFQKSHRHSQ